MRLLDVRGSCCHHIPKPASESMKLVNTVRKKRLSLPPAVVTDDEQESICSTFAAISLSSLPTTPRSQAAVSHKGTSLPVTVVTDDEDESICSTSVASSLSSLPPTPSNQATVPKKHLTLPVAVGTDDEEASVASSLSSWPATPSNQAASLKQSSRPFDHRVAYPKNIYERCVSDDECESTCSDSVASSLSNNASQPQVTRDSAEKLRWHHRGYDRISILESMFNSISLSPDESETTAYLASTSSTSRTTNDSDPSSSGSSSSSASSSSYDDSSDDESSISLPRCPMIREEDSDDWTVKTGDSTLATYNNDLRRKNLN